MRENVKVLSCSCAPPACFEAEFYEDIDGKNMVAITDATGGVAIDTKESFDALVYNYLQLIKGN